MDRLITDAEKVSLGEDDIMNIAMHQTRIVAYSDLPKYGSITELFHPYNNFVLFYETSSLSEGHWVCVLYHPANSTIEFFDSYGFTDAQILPLAATSDHYVHGQPYLTYMIQKSRLNFVYNNKRFQSKKEAMATCGRYAALRARFKDVNMYTFQGLLSNNKYPADFVVSALTVMFSPNAESLLIR